MDYLWSPWRYRYVTTARSEFACIFCEFAASPDQDRENLVVHRAKRNFVLLNRYPYSTGHIMIAPYEHVDTLEAASPETLEESILLAREGQRDLREIYKPSGFNLGMHLGESAGAGIAGHIHMHLLPRWAGDTSFITTVAETRVLPEDLAETWRKLHGAFQNQSARNPL
jgi:ATP adenylyltransferase